MHNFSPFNQSIGTRMRATKFILQMRVYSLEILDFSKLLGKTEQKRSFVFFVSGEKFRRIFNTFIRGCFGYPFIDRIRVNKS